jgi:hypothetical protein
MLAVSEQQVRATIARATVARPYAGPGDAAKLEV